MAKSLILVPTGVIFRALHDGTLYFSVVPTQRKLEFWKFSPESLFDFPNPDFLEIVGLAHNYLNVSLLYGVILNF